MAVLADIYVSSSERAVAYDSDRNAFKQDSASYTGFTSLEMSTLWTALQGPGRHNDLLGQFHEVMAKDGGERLITRLPDEFLHDVASADDVQRDQALAKWAATEELSCDAQDVRPFWDDLKRLADIAIKSGRAVFLWNCV